MFDLPSRAAEIREAIIQDRLRTGFTRSMRFKVAAELRRFAKEAAKGYEEGEKAGAFAAIPDHQNRMNKILSSQYVVVLNAFGLRSIEMAANKGLLLFEKKDAIGDLAKTVQTWANTVASMKALEIASTSSVMLNDAIIAVVGSTISNAEVARGVSDILGKNVPKWRSDRIARTEIHGASQKGVLVGAEQLKVPLIKRWIPVSDHRTRDNHKNVKPVPMGEDFVVGGSPMDHPGDPKGAAKEVINCRCGMTFRRPDRA